MFIASATAHVVKTSGNPRAFSCGLSVKVGTDDRLGGGDPLTHKHGCQPVCSPKSRGCPLLVKLEGPPWQPTQHLHPQPLPHTKSQFNVTTCSGTGTTLVPMPASAHSLSCQSDLKMAALSSKYVCQMMQCPSEFSLGLCFYLQPERHRHKSREIWLPSQFDLLGERPKKSTFQHINPAIPFPRAVSRPVSSTLTKILAVSDYPGTHAYQGVYAASPPT